MHNTMTEQYGPFDLDYPVDIELFRRILREMGYTTEAIGETMDLDEPAGPLSRDIDVHALLRRTEESTPYNTLVRLFILARPVSTNDAGKILEPFRLEDLMALGLLRHDPDGIRAEASLMPMGDIMLASDFWPYVLNRRTRDDFVLGVGPTSLALAHLTVRRKVRLALDLGTGSGFQGIMSAGHSGRVIGTDINARALNFAGFNARLNAVDNLELMQGSLLEPVQDRRFDLVVSNPPFVISPRACYQYRDSGMEGDGVSEHVIRGVPGLLDEGGYGTILFNWHHKDRNDWSDRPHAWISSGGCDALLLRLESRDPITYATSWLARDTSITAGSFPAVLDEWLSYYDRLGIGMISYGAIVLRKKQGINWFLKDTIPHDKPTYPCGDQIQRIFAAQDVLECTENLLERRFVLVDEHELSQTLNAQDGTWKVSSAQLRQTDGIPFTGNVDRLMATVIAGCTGERTMGEIVQDLAGALKMGPEQIVEPCIEVMRKLLQKGFLTVGDTR